MTNGLDQREIAKFGALIAGKEICLIVDDWTANRAPILIALDCILRGRRGKEILRVKGRIADKFKQIAVEGVGEEDEVLQPQRLVEAKALLVLFCHCLDTCLDIATELRLL